LDIFLKFTALHAQAVLFTGHPVLEAFFIFKLDYCTWWRTQVAADAALSILELRHGFELIRGRVEDRVVGIPGFEWRVVVVAAPVVFAVSSEAVPALPSTWVAGAFEVETVRATGSFTYVNAS
jgi:hypothetical protein